MIISGLYYFVFTPELKENRRHRIRFDWIREQKTSCKLSPDWTIKAVFAVAISTRLFWQIFLFLLLEFCASLEKLCFF